MGTLSPLHNSKKTGKKKKKTTKKPQTKTKKQNSIVISFLQKREIQGQQASSGLWVNYLQEVKTTLSLEETSTFKLLGYSLLAWLLHKACVSSKKEWPWKTQTWLRRAGNSQTPRHKDTTYQGQYSFHVPRVISVLVFPCCFCKFRETHSQFRHGKVSKRNKN